MSDKPTRLASVVILGVISAVLYFLLYSYSHEIVAAAAKVRQGDKGFFLLPILIAFVFSYIHGAFTGKFWDAMGVKAASKPTHK